MRKRTRRWTLDKNKAELHNEDDDEDTAEDDAEDRDYAGKGRRLTFQALRHDCWRARP